MVLRKAKSLDRQRKILVMDASSLYRKGRAQNFLDPEHARQIVAWFQAYEAVPHRAAVIDLNDVKAEGWTLSISRYVLPQVDDDVPSLPDTVIAFRDSLAACRAAENHLHKTLISAGWVE
jgi:type I restriction enzyme M protein